MGGRDVQVRAADQPGDLGWMVMAHGEVYASQLGWDSDFEVLVARIVADHAADRRPGRDAGWIAEVDGARVGCVLCVAGPASSQAVLRILLVLPEARGLGVGGLLVTTCVEFARAAGYECLTLWTNDVLASARRIYEGTGFALESEEPHHSFGHDLTGQEWSLTLRSGASRP